MSEVYLGNPNLKKANTPIEFTKENIQEFMKCKDDPVYFANNYIKIVSLDEGLVPFRQYPFQKKLIENFHEHRFNICKMPRQTGKSTTVVSYLLHYAIFNDNVNIAILANKASTARDLLGRLQLAYENLPRWMQQGIISWNKGSLEIENGSKISANSTSSSAVIRSTLPISCKYLSSDAVSLFVTCLVIFNCLIVNCIEDILVNKTLQKYYLFFIKSFSVIVSVKSFPWFINIAFRLR